MRLALNLGYWGGGQGQDAEALALAQEADRLGFAVAWAAEAYGSDVATVLTWVAAHTERIGIGSAIFQIPARSPAMTAMTAATLDSLSGGRMHLGLGVSGPQVSEGWHGTRFDKPLQRTREYVDIVRMALRRDRVQYAGKHYTLPLPDGPGKPLKLIVHPVRDNIPIRSMQGNLPPRSRRCQGVPSSLRNRAHSEATGLSRSSFAMAQRSNSSRASFARCCRASTFPRSRCASPTSGHSSA